MKRQNPLQKAYRRIETEVGDIISRQAAINALFDWEMTYDWDDHCREKDPKPEYIVSPSDVIKRLPPAPPETIHCKDCRHRDDHGCCKYWRGLAMGEIPIATDDNDFCSHAERRNDVFVER